MANITTLSRRGLLLSAGALAAGPLAIGSVHAEPPTTITIGGLPEDANLDPNVITATDWIGLLLNIYDTLLVRDKQGALQPSLATAWRQLDPLTWELTTREGVTFHNGEKFGPEDAAFTMTRIIEGNLTQRFFIRSIQQAVVTGPNTVQFHLEFPEPLLPKILPLIPIVARSATKTSMVRQSNGTGAYRLEKWTPGDQLVIAAAPNYWGKSPTIKRAIYRSIPDPNSLVAALQANEVDIAIGIQPDIAAKLGNASAFSIRSVDTERTIFIVLDNAVKPLDDARVRKALNLAVDREALTHNILLNNGLPIANPFGPTYLGYNKALKPAFDPARAKQLLAEAGYPNGFELTLTSPAGRYMKDREIAETLVGQWGQVGIKVNLVLVEFGTYMTAYRNKKLGPAYLSGVSLPLLDGAQFINTALASASPGGYFKDQQVADDIAAAGRISDETERAAAVSKLSAELFDKDAYVYLYLQRAIFGVAKRLEWTPRANERVLIAEIELAK